jgi:hypothetical protein
MKALAQHYYSLGSRSKTANLRRLEGIASRIGKSLRTPISQLSTKEKVLGGLGSLGAIAAAKGLIPELAGLPGVELGKFLPSKALMESAQTKAYAKTLVTLNQELSANKALATNVQNILDKAPSATEKDLVEYIFNKSMVPAHERLVNASPLSDIIKGALKPADVEAYKALQSGGAFNQRVKNIAKEIVSKDPSFQSAENLLRGSSSLESIRNTRQKLKALAEIKPYLKTLSDKGALSQNPLNKLVTAMRQIPQSQRAGVPLLETILSSKATTGSMDTIAGATTDTLLDALGKIKKVPAANILDVGDAALDTYKNLDILKSLDSYKTRIQGLENTFLPKDSFRLPIKVPKLLEDVEALAYDKGLRTSLVQQAKSNKELGKQMIRAGADAQRARYGIGGPML